MIDFNCHCGFAFSVNDDMAGALVQCPNCRRLNDVPLLSDLGHLEDGGIYKLDEPVTPPTRTVQQLHRTYTRDHYDADGFEIDLRTTMEDVARAGGSEIPLELHDQVLPGAPKYDPVTGELIRPLDVKKDDKPDPRLLKNIPVATPAPKPPRDDGTLGQLELFAIPLRLLSPINLLVMGFILLAHGLGALIATFVGFGFILIAPFLLILLMLILAHYGNVIDETGPTERSELPTPLRSVSWHDDTWGPFFRWTVAFIACYGPALMLWMRRDNFPPHIVGFIALALAIAGTLFFPAALLSCMTSGTVQNLRPDRLIGTMRVIGIADYSASVALWTLGGAIYLLGTVGAVWNGLVALNPYIYNYYVPIFGWTMRLLDFPVSFPALLIGIYLMHYFCWHLGTFYRRFHDQFPWTLQRYTGRRGMHRPDGFAVARPGSIPAPRSQSTTRTV